MARYSYAASAQKFTQDSTAEVLGNLTAGHGFHQLEEQQINAWKDEISILRTLLRGWPSIHLFMEFEIPRIGRRADAVLLINGSVVVLEFKVGANTFNTPSIDQVLDYALDLKNFHKGSHLLTIFPILLATNAPSRPFALKIDANNVARPIATNTELIGEVIKSIASCSFPVTQDPIKWANSPYQPTPTIIEAAQHLYTGHNVDEISRSDAGAINLSLTCNRISEIIHRARVGRQKAICLITGVPGSGKTLAGLNIATRQQKTDNEHAVFLSGNGPLVAVLQEALVRDKSASDIKFSSASRPKKKDAERQVRAFIQNIHHFRDNYLDDRNAPIDKVVIFDEAQRAWNLKQTASFMKRKRGQHNFDMSEPEFLLSVMDRHIDWCVVICLIGGGQEINIGEAGISEWVNAITTRCSDWQVFGSSQLFESNYEVTELAKKRLAALKFSKEQNLHLAVSLRSFRAENLSSFIGELIMGNASAAKEIKKCLDGYPIYVTRDVSKARKRLQLLARGSERIGLVASSNSIRLKAEGIFVKGGLDPVLWFLNDKTDIRSSNFLEDVATEFDVQGLELDWVGVCWDANLRFNDGKWESFNFSGSKWQNVHLRENQEFIANSYRVLLTRGRQGLVIFVPEGDNNDITRLARFYDPVYEFLLRCGIEAF